MKRPHGVRQLQKRSTETARMTRGLCLLFSLCACGCSAHQLIPALSLHAVLVLQRRGQERAARGRDFALTAQLAFGGARPRVKARGDMLERLPRIKPQSAPACEETALCEWARMAEESALAALGVSP